MWQMHDTEKITLESNPMKNGNSLEGDSEV